MSKCLNLQTKVNEELIQEPKSTNNRNKVKYCCLCANRGHYPEQCNRANRMPGPLSVSITSYRNVLKSTATIDKKIPKCTILTSDLNDYTFNFGNDVSSKGNTIYGRFRRAVNLNANQSNVSENDVEFVAESNLHDTSDPPIEIYDDSYDFEMDDLDDVSSTDQFSEDTTHDDSFVTIDNFDAEEGEDDEENEKEADANDTNEQQSDANNVLSANKEAVIKRLDDKIHTLEELKGKMLSQIDINVSGQKDDVTTSSALPDFIPLTSEEPEKFEPARSPSPISADSTTTTSEKSDATIHLSSQHCKQLLTEKGNQFLRDSEIQYNVSVRLEWRQYGNVLIVNGIASNQQIFHNILKDFFESAENPQKANFTNLPKNREALIKYVRSQVIILDSALCNVKHIADVQGLFHRLQKIKTNPSKANVKESEKLRKHLNMVLCGRYGLGEGKFHLNALQECLRRVLSVNTQNVSIEVRRKIGEHIAYIFSGNDHKNYEDMIEHYNQMKKDRTLPPLNLDRKLMGLKINVFPNNADNSFNNTPQRRNSFKNSTPQFSNRSSTITSANNQNNRLNAPPSLLDIQINVSRPSTSSSYQNQNQSMQRSNSFSSNRSNILDKWKY